MAGVHRPEAVPEVARRRDCKARHSSRSLKHVHICQQRKKGSSASCATAQPAAAAPCTGHGTVGIMHMPCRLRHVSVGSPTWQSSRPYFSVSRTAVQHDCLAVMWRTVLAVQRRHWSPWTCGVHNAVVQLFSVCCLPLECAAGRKIEVVFNNAVCRASWRTINMSHGTLRHRCVLLQCATLTHVQSGQQRTLWHRAMYSFSSLQRPLPAADCFSHASSWAATWRHMRVASVAAVCRSTTGGPASLRGSASRCAAPHVCGGGCR
jgi:hypothetical protein